MFVFFISGHHPRIFQGFSLDTPIFRNVPNFGGKKMFVAGCPINNVDHHEVGQTMIEKLPIVMILSFLLKKNILTILDKGGGWDAFQNSHLYLLQKHQNELLDLFFKSFWSNQNLKIKTRIFFELHPYRKKKLIVELLNEKKVGLAHMDDCFFSF